MSITGKFAVAVLGALALAAMAGSAFAQQPAVVAASGTLAISDAGAVGTPRSLGAAGTVADAQTAMVPVSGSVAVSDAGAVGTPSSLGAAAARTVIAKQ